MSRDIRVAIVLPGLHRVNRGAEVAFEAIGRGLARTPGFHVTLIGTGEVRATESYCYQRVWCIPRERFHGWPRVPALRSETAWEDLTFVCGLMGVYRPSDFDVTITCSFPWTNLWLRRGRPGRRPKHLFVTQNGDWPCYRKNAEYRWFGCDGLVCTNPVFFESHRQRYSARLIPNGVDPEVFQPGQDDRARFALPGEGLVVLMVSALISSKRVSDAIRAVSRLKGATLVVAGDGPLRDEVERLGRELMGDRFRRVSVARADMPALYRSASVFLHMSVNESSANAYLEAMAVGLPIVAHANPVTRWTFEDTAELLDTEDLNTVAEGISRVARVDAPDHRARRRELAIRRFTWNAIAADYAAFIEAVHQGRAAT